MIHLTRLLALVVLIFFTLGIALAQRSRPASSPTKPAASQPRGTEKELSQSTIHRQVTVNLKNGPPVTGQFIQADPATIQIEVAGNLLKIKVDDVASLVFAPDFLPKLTVEASAPPQDEGATRAWRALRKLAGATEVGINFQEYGSRLIDVKNEVDDATSRMPAGDLKLELNLAMEAYVDAGQAWNQMIRYDFMLPNAEPGLTLIKKYSLQPVELVPGNRSTLALPRNYVLTTLWATARLHIERSNAEINPTQKPSSTETSTTETAAESKENESATKPVNIVGTWLVTLSLGNQSSQTRFTITSGGGTFTGQFVSPQGTTPVNRIDLVGNTITASFQDVVDRQRVSIELFATIDGDRMTGTTRVIAANGQSVTVPISGTRQ